MKDAQWGDEPKYFAKTIIIPIWTYGLELWGCVSKSNISIIQRSQSKILRMIADAPWHVSNAKLHADLDISYVQAVIHQKCNKHHTKTETHETPLLKILLARVERLKETGQFTDLRYRGFAAGRLSIKTL
jgi:uncharacterized membrane protein